MKNEQLEGQSPKASAIVASGTIMDGRYRIESEIGSGGMCVVYRATQLDLERPVAVKMPLPRLRSNAKALARFFNEAVATAHLNHPNIVEVYAVGQHDDVPYIAMEFLEGISLGAYIAAQPDQRLTEEQTLPLTVQLCDALQYAHDAGLIHRDIKPSNIMLVGPDKKTVKIVDFGIAKVMDELGMGVKNLTASGEVLGSVSYMSPEQCRSQTVDSRTDLYSLGCVIYEMLTGQPPFVGATPYAVLMKQAEQDFQLPKEISATRFDCILSHLLQKDPARRPASAAAAKDLLIAPKSKASRRRVKLISLAVICLLSVGPLVWKLGELLALKQQETHDLKILPQISGAIDQAEHYPLESAGSDSRRSRLDFAAAKLEEVSTHKREVLRLWMRLARTYPAQYAAKEILYAAGKARAMMAKDPALAASNDHLELDLLFCTADAYDRLNQPEQAIAYYLRYREWLQAHGSKAERDEWFWLNYRLGNLFFQRQNWEAAAASYNESLRTTLNHYGKSVNTEARVDATNSLVRCYMNLGRRDEAAHAYALQAHLFMQDGDYSAALRSVERAIALHNEPSAQQLRTSIKEELAAERGQHSRK